MPHPVFALAPRAVLLVAAASGVAVVVRRVLAAPSPQPAPAPATDLARENPQVGEVPEVAEVRGSAEVREPRADSPSPASIAKNVPHQRPVATPKAAPTDARASTPDDSPGGKLPPRR